VEFIFKLDVPSSEAEVPSSEAQVPSSEGLSLMTQDLMLYRVPTDLEILMQILVGILMQG